MPISLRKHVLSNFMIDIDQGSYHITVISSGRHPRLLIYYNGGE